MYEAPARLRVASFAHCSSNSRKPLCTSQSRSLPLRQKHATSSRKNAWRNPPDSLPSLRQLNSCSWRYSFHGSTFLGSLQDIPAESALVLPHQAIVWVIAGYHTSRRGGGRRKPVMPTHVIQSLSRYCWRAVSRYNGGVNRGSCSLINLRCIGVNMLYGVRLPL